MRKWLIGIAAVCLGCVIANQIAQWVMPPRPDEELIVRALLAPQPVKINDYWKKDDFKVGIEEKWNEPEGLFDSQVLTLLSQLQADLKSTEGRKGAATDDQVEWDQKVSREIQELQAVVKQAPKGTYGLPRSRWIQISALRLPPSLITVSAAAGPAAALETCSLTYPVFSKDKNFAFVIMNYASFHTSIGWFCLARTNGGWRVIASRDITFL